MGGDELVEVGDVGGNGEWWRGQFGGSLEGFENVEGVGEFEGNWRGGAWSARSAVEDDSGAGGGAVLAEGEHGWNDGGAIKRAEISGVGVGLGDCGWFWGGEGRGFPGEWGVDRRGGVQGSIFS